MAVYEEMLAELKRGVKISKPFGSLSEGTDIVISQVPDSVTSHNESTLMIDADTTLYLEKDGGRVFHSTPRLHRHSRKRPQCAGNIFRRPARSKPVQPAERMSGLLWDAGHGRERGK
ncbi:MAG: hypothetical protein ACLUN5_17645 [Oscillospiraceae bacterium]